VRGGARVVLHAVRGHAGEVQVAARRGGDGERLLEQPPPLARIGERPGGDEVERAQEHVAAAVLVARKAIDQLLGIALVLAGGALEDRLDDALARRIVHVGFGVDRERPWIVGALRATGAREPHGLGRHGAPDGAVLGRVAAAVDEQRVAVGADAHHALEGIGECQLPLGIVGCGGQLRPRGRDGLLAAGEPALGRDAPAVRADLCRREPQRRRTEGPKASHAGRPYTEAARGDASADPGDRVSLRAVTGERRGRGASRRRERADAEP